MGLNLFNRKEEPPVDPYLKVTAKDASERQWQQDFSRFDESSRGRIESDTAFKMELLNPTKINQGMIDKGVMSKSPSPYHDVLTKDIKISFTNADDSMIGMQYLNIIHSCIFLGGDNMDLDETALIYHAQLEGMMGFKGSEGGQFLKELNTQRQNLNRQTADVSGSQSPVNKMPWR